MSLPKLLAIAILALACTTTYGGLLQDEKAGLKNLIDAFVSIPSCKLDGAVKLIDLKVCHGFLNFIDSLAKGDDVEPICESKCADQWRTLSNVCLRDAFDEFSAPESSITAPTLAYWAACTASNIAESIYGPEDGSLGPAAAPALAPDAADAVSPDVAPSQAPAEETLSSTEAFNATLNKIADFYEDAISNAAEALSTAESSLTNFNLPETLG